MTDSIDITKGIAVLRVWDNTYLTAFDVTRIFETPRNAKLAARHDMKHYNRMVRPSEFVNGQWKYTGDYEYVNGLGREVTTDDYKICFVQIITEPLEEIQWN